MLRLQTLGATDLRRDGVEVRSVLAQPKRLALLAYLATERSEYHSRDALLGLFWPDQEQDRARNALRQALHYLRRSLGEDVLVSRGDREIGVSRTALVCDAASFDAAIAGGRHEEALELYRGDFLAGLFIDDAGEAERWLDEARARRQRQALASALLLAERAADARGAVQWARRAAALAPYEEAPVRELVRALAAAGELAAALEVYGEFEGRLAQELELEPSPALRQLVGQLASGDVAQPASATLISAPLPVPVAPAPAAGADPVSSPRTAATATIPAAGDAAGPSVERVHWSAPARPRGRVWRRSRRVPVRWLVAAAAIVAVLSATAGWYASARRIAPAPAPAAIPAIAVIPFANLSGTADDEYFSDGVTDEILATLAGLEGLRVAARTSSFAFKGRQIGVDSIGRALGVGYILEGSVRRTEQRLKITAQLVDVSDGFPRWSSTYDRELQDVFAVQEEIARAIADALQIRLAAALQRGSGTRSPEAYDRYLRGQHLISVTSEERNRLALGFFREALALDPGFAAAHAGLARALIAMAEFVTPTEVLPAARAAALRALELDSTLVDTRLVLADVRRVLDRDWAAAEAEIRRALLLDAASARAHMAYARFLLDARRFAEARRAADRAWAIRAREAPDSLLPAFRQERMISVGAHELYVGRAAQAREQARQALALDPTNVTARWLLAIAELRSGRVQAAVTELERIRDMTAGASPYLAQLAHAYGRAGRRAEAAAILDTLRVRMQSSYVPKDQVALIHAGLGAADSAIVWLQRAVDEYHWWLPSANAHPLWHDLRTDPRFVQLMASIGAP